MLSINSKKFERVFSLLWLWLILAVWGIFFSRAWLGQVYAKWREVRAFGNLSYEKQLSAIYSNEMALLQEKVGVFSRENKQFLLVVPEKPWLYPIANNPPLLRALTKGAFDVVPIESVSATEQGVVFWHPEQFFYKQVFPIGIQRVTLEEVQQ